LTGVAAGRAARIARRAPRAIVMAAPGPLGRNDRIRGGAQMLTGVVTAASRPAPRATSDG